MQPKTPDLIALQTGNLSLQKSTVSMSVADLFAERRGSFLNEKMLFLAHFDAIPNYINEIKIDCRKANAWFMEQYKTAIRDVYFNKVYIPKAKPERAEYDDIFYFLYEDLIVDFDNHENEVRFLFRSTDITKVEAIIAGIKKFKKRKPIPKPGIILLVCLNHGIAINHMEIAKPRLSIADNYNDDFTEIHETIYKRLSKKNDKGIVLLHGKPGTGKTSYIRYLIASVKKKVIFLPPSMAGSINDPDLLSILVDNPNSIFVIEDAENIVMDREQHGNSAVSALLNISDGLLSDCLNIQIICSFNTDIDKVDSALMRKGRLIAKYEFKQLATAKAQALSNKLGYTTTIQSPQTLAAIYNQEEKEFHQTNKYQPIGFRMAEAV